MKIDTEWFNDLIRKSPYGSQRRFARKIRGRHGKPLDPSALSLMLRGKRAMQLHEARQFADILDVPLADVIRHAGIAVPDDGARTVPVIGYVDQSANLHLLDSKNPELVPGPADLPPDCVAVRCRTGRSEHDLIDGWLLYALKPQPASADVVGRFCLAAPKDGRPTMGFVLRGYKPGTFNLMSGFYGTLTAAENVAFDWVAPVVWLRP